MRSLTPSTIDELRRRMRGAVLTPEHPGFEESRTVWNGMIERRPAIVARCIGAADVIAGVEFARERDLLLCIKCGGHNIAGLAVADDALLLDLSHMRGVWVDTKRRVAQAQGGCLLGDVDRETQLHGLAAVLGFVSQTGISGLTLGGGIGYLTRRWGWTSDTAIGMDVVTAGARLVRASESDNPDLFWALRGGGGNFGVVTAIDYALNPIGPEIVGGPVAWHASEAPRVLELYRTVAEQSPRELTLVTAMRPAPPAPWLPADVHGKPIIMILACYTGDPRRADEVVAPIKSFGRPVGDALIRRPYCQMQSLLDATQPKGRRYYWKSEYLPRIEPALCAKVIEHAAKTPSPHASVILFQMDGALNELAPDHSAVGNRDARYLLNIAGAWESPNADAENIAWTRDTWSDLKAFSTGGTYLNFLTEDEGPERTEAALSVSLPRLAKAKHTWDPANVFRTNRNIKPDAAARVR